MKKNLVIMSANILILLTSGAAQAAEPLAFQGVMRDLGKHMQTVAGAIAHEDWKQVAKTAPLIAEHPQPPLTEKMRIMSFVGGNMGKFKTFDIQTHEAAHDMEQAAIAQDGMQVINSYQKVQTACLGCHQAFRAQFVAHFYGKQSIETSK